MAFNELVLAYVERLKTPAMRVYAKAQWDFLNGEATRPDPLAYGVLAGDAQTIRVKLAQSRLPYRRPDWRGTCDPVAG